VAWQDQELDKADNALWIATQNIGTLYAAAERHTATKAHVYAWQEVEVPRWERKVTGDNMAELGYSIRYGWEESNHCDEVIHSKVAMAFARGMSPQALEYHDAETVQLAAS
jgi:hypothetical protein